MESQTSRNWVGWSLIAVLIATPAAAAAPRDHEAADPRDAVAPELFAHYAKERLIDLRAEVGAIGRVLSTFDRRCRLQHEREKTAADDCQVAADARTHLAKVIAEERHLVERLVRDGHGGEEWMAFEVNDFWYEVHEAGR